MVVDRVIYDMTGTSKRERVKCFAWMKKKKFKEDRDLACWHAGFYDATFVVKCIEKILESAFPKVYKEYNLFK